MNNKGFTLIEMLATIAILSLVMGIATIGVINTINNSKTRSEKLFVDNLEKVIDEYLNWYGSSLVEVDDGEVFSKSNDENNTYTANAYELKKSDGNSITFLDLINENLIDVNKAINPRNKKKCFDGVYPKIRVFKDSDMVYYYYADLSGTNTSCSILENGIIDTLPSTLKEKVSL